MIEKDFIYKVRDMRSLQKAYKGKRSVTANKLIKIVEADVDRLIEELIKKL